MRSLALLSATPFLGSSFCALKVREYAIHCTYSHRWDAAGLDVFGCRNQARPDVRSVMPAWANPVSTRLPEPLHYIDREICDRFRYRVAHPKGDLCNVET